MFRHFELIEFTCTHCPIAEKRCDPSENGSMNSIRPELNKKSMMWNTRKLCQNPSRLHRTKFSVYKIQCVYDVYITKLKNGTETEWNGMKNGKWTDFISLSSVRTPNGFVEGIIKAECLYGLAYILFICQCTIFTLAIFCIYLINRPIICISLGM